METDVFKRDMMHFYEQNVSGEEPPMNLKKYADRRKKKINQISKECNIVQYL